MITLWALVALFSVVALFVSSLVYPATSLDDDTDTFLFDSRILASLNQVSRVGLVTWQIAGFFGGSFRAYFLSERMWRRAYWSLVIALPFIGSGLLLYTTSNVFCYTLQPNAVRAFCGNPDTCTSAQVAAGAVCDGFAKLGQFAASVLLLRVAAALAEERIGQASELVRVMWVMVGAASVCQGVGFAVQGSLYAAWYFFASPFFFLAYFYSTWRREGHACQGRRHRVE